MNGKAKQKQGAIPALVKLLLDSSTSGVQEQAAGALANICHSFEDNQVKAGEHDAIPALVELLNESETPGVQEQAAGALANICLI